MSRNAKESEAHEALCRRCGRCCYEKLIVDGRVFTTERPCTHYDERTRLCRIYEARRRMNPRCLTVAEGIRWGVFPADCPYVQDLEDYLPAEEGWLSAEIVERIEAGELQSAEEIRAAMR